MGQAVVDSRSLKVGRQQHSGVRPTLIHQRSTSTNVGKSERGNADNVPWQKGFAEYTICTQDLLNTPGNTRIAFMIC